MENQVSNVEDELEKLAQNADMKKKRGEKTFKIPSEFSLRIAFETCILSRVKQITNPGWMHETSARTWYTGKTQRNRVEREVGEGIGMGNTCKSMADSCQCMTKTTTILYSN